MYILQHYYYNGLLVSGIIQYQCSSGLNAPALTVCGVCGNYDCIKSYLSLISSCSTAVVEEYIVVVLLEQLVVKRAEEDDDHYDDGIPLMSEKR